ncbi:hypothetical protein Tco_0221471 [Tanacetum coccineum]
MWSCWIFMTALRGEFDVMRSRERAREEECKGLQVKCEAESKVTSLEAEKARLEAVKVSLHKEVEELKHDRREVVSKVVPYAAMELVHSDDMGSLIGRLVSSTLLYRRCRAYEQVVDMKEPFDLSKVKGYRSSYKKDHTQASNDFTTATFPWLDKFVADPSAPIEVFIVEEASISSKAYSFNDSSLLAYFSESYSILDSSLQSDVSSCRCFRYEAPIISTSMMLIQS